MVADNVVARTISHALTRGAEPMATFATPEAPGHHACMLYAAIACPYLSRSTARRTIAGHGSTAQESVTAGTRRGMFSGLVCFAEAVVENPADTYGYTIVYKRPSVFALTTMESNFVLISVTLSRENPALGLGSGCSPATCGLSSASFARHWPSTRTKPEARTIADSGRRGAAARASADATRRTPGPLGAVRSADKPDQSLSACMEY